MKGTVLAQSGLISRVSPTWRKGILSILVSVSFFVAAAAWAVATPPMSSADDDFHMTSVVCTREDAGYCIKKDGLTVFVPKTLTTVPCYANVLDRGADCLRWEPEWTETTRWNSDTGDRVSVYYTVMSWFIGGDLWKSILSMRLANSLFAAIVLGITVFVVSLPGRRGVALGVLTVLFPVGIFHIASTNPTGWAIIGLAVFWVYLAEAWSDSRGRNARIAFLVGAALAALVAVSGRSDSVVYLGASVVAVGILKWRPLRRSLWWLAPVPITMVLALLVGWDRLRNGFGFAFLDPPRLAGLLTEWWPRFHVLDWPLLLHYVIGGATPVSMPYPISYSSGLGWDSRAAVPIEFPATVSILALLAVASVVWIGLSRYSPRKLVAVLVVLASVFVMSFGWVWLTEFRAWAQARYYVAPLMVVVGLLVFDSRQGPFFRKAQAGLLWLLVVVAGVAGLKTVIGRTTNGQALVPGQQWSVYDYYVMWWWPNIGVDWPLSPNYTVVMGGVALAVLAAVLIHLSQGDVPSRRGNGNMVDSRP